MDIKAKDTSAGAGLNWRHKPRRSFTREQRLAMVLECAQPGVSVAQVARRNGINANLLFTWRRQHSHGRLVATSKTAPLLPVMVVKPTPKPKPEFEPKREDRIRPTGSRKVVARSAGAIEIELAGARIYLHGSVCEANLHVVLKALERR